MIYIDFLAGSHGNFLEFACNTLLAKIESDRLPFNSLGASHNKNYLGEKVFKSIHLLSNSFVPTNSKIISIRITPDDLLPLSSISLLRAGDYNLNNDELEINTYNKFAKLSDGNYQWVLDNIIEKFSFNQIQDSYNAVKDPSWPVVQTLNDFKNLPEWIRIECLEQHNLQLVEITEQTPDCPRWILREFFKIGFKDPDQSGFMTKQNNITYDSSNNIHYFPFGCFYNLEWFKQELQSIATWTNLDYSDPTELHTEFIKHQPYCNDKILCDNILARIYQGEKFELPNLDLMKESYLTAQLELHYNKEFSVHQLKWFTHSNEILEFVTA